MENEFLANSFDKLNFDQLILDQILPHSDPMILISRVIEADDESILCEVDISPQSQFFDQAENGVPAWVGIEYMAQSIAAHAGIQAKLINQPIRVGFLLGSRRYQSDIVSFSNGVKLQVQVKRLYQEESGLASFESEIMLDQKSICRAKLNVFSPQDVEQFFQHK